MDKAQEEATPTRASDRGALVRLHLHLLPWCCCQGVGLGVTALFDREKTKKTSWMSSKIPFLQPFVPFWLPKATHGAVFCSFNPRSEKPVSGSSMASQPIGTHPNDHPPPQKCHQHGALSHVGNQRKDGCEPMPSLWPIRFYTVPYREATKYQVFAELKIKILRVTFEPANPLNFSSIVPSAGSGGASPCQHPPPELC